MSVNGWFPSADGGTSCGGGYLACHDLRRYAQVVRLGSQVVTAYCGAAPVGLSWGLSVTTDAAWPQEGSGMSDFDELAERAEGDFDLGDFARAVRACRSFRRFDEGEPIPPTLLVALVDLARDVASGANRLPLRYRIVTEASERESVFSQLKWAGALKDWDGPAAGERPTGYIVVCDAGGGATTAVDEGIAAQTILLAATQAGFGGCMLHAFNHSAVEAALGLEAEARERNLAQLKPLMVIALGRPAETVRLEPLEASPDGSTNYWRDDASVHHVPKRSLEDVLL